jgi:hypothetical protein
MSSCTSSSAQKGGGLSSPDVRDDLGAYLGGIIREMRGTALIINGTADHVHVLARIRPVIHLPKSRA